MIKLKDLLVEAGFWNKFLKKEKPVKALCNDCGWKFNVSIPDRPRGFEEDPKCPRCQSYDIEPLP